MTDVHLLLEPECDEASGPGPLDDNDLQLYLPLPDPMQHQVSSV